MSDIAAQPKTRESGTAPWGVIPAAGVSVSAFLLFAVQQPIPGYLVLVASIAVAFAAGRELGKDLLLIGVGLGIVSSVSVEANLEWGNIVLLGFVLTAAVVVPFVLDRYVYKHRTIQFPVRRREPWTRLEKSYLGIAVVLAYLILPVYFIGSGAYRNWPAVHEWHEIARLFVGVNAVGIWDELFFICIVFTLFLRHFPLWVANILQAVVFVSFLWELGYREWGPAITIPFALIQAYIFTKTRSLVYVICVHLLFDLFVFLVIVRAHNPGAIPIFLFN
ncbi:CPBP family intramembrane glutamic endopeptidase [Amnibacterium flavum]|uniref:Abortive phage infection protein n=1 Tax=Amnibacterium flavum TaxID=2173173 RepID=A0A2V1HPK8_9MICO|nr:CPBP family intramembrane glutamic endopeptidase [Amnibacterium flavum]PVZ94478.1 abortive phage infection protein [Amnibacterium flavum]